MQYLDLLLRDATLMSPKLYKAIRCLKDCTELQRAMSCADTWSKESNIKFNPSKCHAPSITRRKTPFRTSYHLGSTDIKSVEQEVDLGVVVTSDRTWTVHIKGTVGKATGC